MILALLLTFLSPQALPDIKMNCRGEEKSLMTVLDKSPALMTFIFARCAGMCSPLVESMNRRIESMGGPDGYQVLVLSFDPRDRAGDMEKLQQRLGLSDESSWSFCTAPGTDIERITSAAGFSYAWDQERMQFDHPGMVVALDKQGRIIRTINGLPIDPTEFKSLIRELKGNFVPLYPLPQKTILSCLSYDAEKARVHLDWGFAVLFIPSVFSVLLTYLIFSRKIGSKE